MVPKKTYRLFEGISDVDISETDIWEYEPDILNHLLIDHTMSAKVRREAKDMTKFANIFWATNDYSELNEGYQYNDQI